MWFHAQLDKKSWTVSSVGFSVTNFGSTLWSINDGTAGNLWEPPGTNEVNSVAAKILRAPAHSINLINRGRFPDLLCNMYRRIPGGSRLLHH